MEVKAPQRGLTRLSGRQPSFGVRSSPGRVAAKHAVWLQACVLVALCVLLGGCIGSQNTRQSDGSGLAKADDGRGLSREKSADNSAMRPRHALVIGNSRYRNSPLANPANDANAIAQSLNILRFKVDPVFDADRQEIIDVVRKFGRRLAETGGVGVFYYAGHAVQLNGRNYLIPIDADIRRQQDIPDEAVDVEQILGEMGSAADQTNIVILDACRDSPFSGDFRATDGLAPMDAEAGTLIAYATAPGETAADGTGVHGTYTKHLLQQMRHRDMPVETVFKRVRTAVLNETNGKQTPWEHSSLRDDFYFSGGTSGLANYDKNPPPPLKIQPLPSSTSRVNPWMALLEYEKPWYKRPYIWAGILVGAAVIACSGGGESGADGGGAGGGC